MNAKGEKMILKHRAAALGLLAAAILLTSCVGVDTKVKISDKGSGTVAAEYKLSEELVAFGELEDNKALLPIPLTKADVENSLRGAPGLKLDSWSSRKDGTDLIIKTVIAFEGLDALMYYLDPKGRLAKHSLGPEGHSIAFSVGERLPSLDPDMKPIAEEAFSPYDFSFAVELPSPPKSASSDHAAVSVRTVGNTVYYEGKMKDIVASETAPSMFLSW